ncbi:MULTISPECIES: hypothetical protein [unclassified Arcicella]|uniref:hypothetical protein n=1 Tax=unclassified Arcicella TaxID=2644986 RepID=UPI00285E3035|nr:MULTISPECIES: hypothetical protein [unclassified Arcicella]MDR6560790.1 hypothetical protein [Arcicella sp. BE51]MDR6810674.1 hypothetical protein [Arcicella sp. BE140]MDR6822024.1 hypothetical protein [Arcicella sp. BE139]
MFEVISHPFTNAGEGLSGIVIEKTIETVLPQKSSGFSFWRFLYFFLLIVFIGGIYLVYFYFPKKRREEKLNDSEMVKEDKLLVPIL